jgi:hypothetical protein
MPDKKRPHPSRPATERAQPMPSPELRQASITTSLPYVQADAPVIRKIQAGFIKYALEEARLGNRLALMSGVRSFCSFSDDDAITRKLLKGHLSLRRVRQILIAGWIESLVASGACANQTSAVEIAMDEFGIERRSAFYALKALRKMRGTA